MHACLGVIWRGRCHVSQVHNVICPNGHPSSPSLFGHQGPSHSIYNIYQDSKLLALDVYFSDYGTFGQSNMHSTLDFCPRPAREEMTQSFTEEKKGLDFSPRSGEATSGEK